MADSGAIPVMGLQLREGRPARPRTVLSWALWDWAAQPFNTVILTFIFTALYLTTDAFLPAEIAMLGDKDPIKMQAEAGLAAGLGWGTTIAGLLILALAPVLGQQADAAGRQKLWLGIGTGGLVMSMALLWFVEPAPALFWLGVALISAGTVFSEIAGVNYNAMLIGIATPRTIGRVSALGWGFGYLGGIVALILVVVFFMSDWFGLDPDNGLPFRIIAIGCALWTVLFAIPIFLWVPEPSPGRPERRVGLLRGYRLLVADVMALYRSPQSRPTFWFLLSSAVFRDGLGGVFTFGAIIAGQVYGFEFMELVIFGIAANLVAGVSTLVVGRWDDRLGPEDDHPVLARGDDRRGIRRLLPGGCRHRGVLGRRSAAVRLRRPGAVGVAVVPRSPHPRRPGRRDLRPLRHDGTRGQLDDVAAVGTADQPRRRDVVRDPRHRAGAAGRVPAAAAGEGARPRRLSTRPVMRRHEVSAAARPRRTG